MIKSPGTASAGSNGVFGALTSQPTTAPTRDAGNVPYVLSQTGLPMILGPSGFMTATGIYIIGQPPSTSGTATFGATSGSTTVTFSAATLLNSASDVGRVLTINDSGTYKFFTITAQSSTTVATGTITGSTLSTTGAWANANLYLSGTAQTLGNTPSFGAVLPTSYASAFMYFPASSSTTVAGFFYATPYSTTTPTIWQVYNNAYSGTGTPVIPGGTVAFSGLTPAQFTQTTGANSVNFISASLPGNVLGVNGGVEFDVQMSSNNSANAHNIGIVFGAAAGFGFNPTSQVNNYLWYRVRNTGVTGKQVTAEWQNSPTASTLTGVAPGRISVDTTTAQTLLIQGGIVTQYDYEVVESYSITVKPN